MKNIEVVKFDTEKPKKADDDTCERPSELNDADLNWKSSKQPEKIQTR